jgi:hypothetical protein
MSYAGVTSCRGSQKANDMQMGLAYHVVPRIVKIINHTMLAGRFCNDILILMLI